MKNIARQDFLNEIQMLFEIFPVVAILGPRQSGKSTLAHQFRKTSSSKTHYFDLENELDLAQLTEAQMSLKDLEGLIIIDEIQRRPNLFPTLRYLVDVSQQKYLSSWEVPRGTSFNKQAKH